MQNVYFRLTDSIARGMSFTSYKYATGDTRVTEELCKRISRGINRIYFTGLFTDAAQTIQRDLETHVIRTRRLTFINVVCERQRRSGDIIIVECCFRAINNSAVESSVEESR